MQKDDPRIKIISNKKNMGVLYSRSIGVLQAKGQYILNLDHDDFFFDEDVLSTAYKAAQNGDFDITSFIYLEGTNYTLGIEGMKDGYCTDHPNNLIVYQPELSYYPLFKKEKFAFVDTVIWGKLFKNEVYKKAVHFLGEEIYSTYNIFNEDLVGIFAIFNVAKSYKYIRKFGIFHLIDNPTASQFAPLEHKLYAQIFLGEVLFDLSKNENKKYAAIYIKTLYPSTNKNNIYLRKVLKKIINSEYIQEKYKKDIRIKFEPLGFLK